MQFTAAKRFHSHFFPQGTTVVVNNVSLKFPAFLQFSSKTLDYNVIYLNKFSKTFCQFEHFQKHLENKVLRIDIY